MTCLAVGARHFRFASVVLAMLAAACAGPAMKPPTTSGANAQQMPDQPPPPPVSVIDGNAWTPAIATVSQAVQQAALANGDVEVVRTADNRLLVRIETNVAVQRSDAALQARYSDFMESLVVALSSYPSVQVRVVAYGGASGKTSSATKQQLTWARSVLRFLATRGVGAERLTARAGNLGDAAFGNGGLESAQSRRIEVLLSDPLS
jgi:outer membrane protein OmpA-like peptidoglycan-associated protein